MIYIKHWAAFVFDCSTDDEMNHTVEPGRTSRKWKIMMIREWFGVQPFRSTQGTVHVLRYSYSISPFSSGIHCPDHRFYINRCPRDEVHES